MEKRDILVRWLRDAYAMEKSLVPVLTNHAQDIKDNPEAQQRIQQHIEETEQQAETVKSCLQSLDEDTSLLKTAAGRVFGMLNSVSTGAMGDEIVRNAVLDYATEHFEAASYKAIIELANQLGETEIADNCQQILEQELEMAEWLDQNLPTTVSDYVRTEAAEPAFRERLEDDGIED